MEAQQYLMQIGKGMAVINKLREELKNLKESDELVENVSRIVDLENELEIEVSSCGKLYLKAIRKVDSLENIEYKEILFKRYFALETWEQIGTELGYSLSEVHAMHEKALAEFEKTLNKVA